MSVLRTMELIYLRVFLRSLSFLEQRLSVPIILSKDYDASLALCTAVIPSAAFVLGYNFYLKPRRRAQRIAYVDICPFKI